MMKKLSVAVFCFQAVAIFTQVSANDDFAALEPYSKPLPENASLTIVGFECLIFSVAFPTMYLHMQENIISPDVLQMREGNPILGEGLGMWDWSGIWQVQKNNDDNEMSNSSYLLKDHASYDNEMLTFAPKDKVPKRGSVKVMGTLWNLNMQTQSSIITTIKSAVDQNWLLTAQIDPWTKTPTGMVEMDLQDQGDHSSWKITCDDHSSKIQN